MSGEVWGNNNRCCVPFKRAQRTSCCVDVLAASWQQITPKRSNCINRIYLFNHTQRYWLVCGILNVLWRKMRRAVHCGQCHWHARASNTCIEYLRALGPLFSKIDPVVKQNESQWIRSRCLRSLLKKSVACWHSSQVHKLDGNSGAEKSDDVLARCRARGKGGCVI